MKDFYDDSIFNTIISNMKMKGDAKTYSYIDSLFKINDEESLLNDSNWTVKKIYTYEEYERKFKYYNEPKRMPFDFLLEIKNIKLKRIENKIENSIPLEDEEWFYLLKKHSDAINDFLLNSIMKQKINRKMTRIEYKVLFKDNSQKILSNAFLFKTFIFNSLRMQKFSLKDTIVYKENLKGVKKDYTSVISYILDKTANYSTLYEDVLNKFSHLYLNELKDFEVIKDFERIEKSSGKVDLLNKDFLSELLWEMNKNTREKIDLSSIEKIKESVEDYILNLNLQYESIGLKETEIKEARRHITSLKEEINKLINIIGKDIILTDLTKQLTEAENRLEF